MDPDLTPHSVVFDPGLHCLHRPVCHNTFCDYDIFEVKWTNKILTIMQFFSKQYSPAVRYE